MFRAVPDADVCVTMVLAAAQVQDRMAYERLIQVDSFSPERKAASREKLLSSFGLEASEFHEWGRLRTRYGYAAEQAADILIRSRRPSAHTPPGAP